MSVPYNSELIFRLYNETNPRKARAIVEEMVEINDQIFVFPILAVFAKFKDSFYSHYFLSYLMSFNTPETIDNIKKIITEVELKNSWMSYLIDFCIDNEFFPEGFTRQVEHELNEDVRSNPDGYDLTPYFKYFIAIKQFDKIEGLVIAILEDNDMDITAREAALRYLLKFDAKKYFQYYYDNYQKIQGKQTEIILVREIIKRGWKGTIVERTKELIASNGSERAKEIIQEKEKKDIEAEKNQSIKEEELVNKNYANAEIISDISVIMDKISALTAGDSRFNFSLLESSGLLPKQLTPASDSVQLSGFCIDLRSIIQKFNKKVSEHGITEDKAKELFPNIETTGSINNCQLFLASVGIGVDDDFFGLRRMNKLIAALAHPDENREELVKQLRLSNLFDLYQEENWGLLHKRLLETYKDFLLLLQEAIRNTQQNVTVLENIIL